MHKSIAAIIQQEFQTQRLTLATLRNDDAPFILELTNTKGWLQFIGDRKISSIDLAIKYIEKIEHNPNLKYWKVSLKENQAAIGVITLIKRDFLEDLDIGFAFLPQYAKKGYAFEASHFILNQVLPLTDNGLIFAITKAENAQSIKLLEKLGLKVQSTREEGKELVYVISTEK